MTFGVCVATTVGIHPSQKVPVTKPNISHHKGNVSKSTATISNRSVIDNSHFLGYLTSFTGSSLLQLHYAVSGVAATAVSIAWAAVSSCGCEMTNGGSRRRTVTPAGSA